jgi:hypothetical protein
MLNAEEEGVVAVLGKNIYDRGIIFLVVKKADFTFALI